MSKDNTVILGDKSREEILKGIEAVSSAVKKTLGARGRLALIKNQFGLGFVTTKDGVTVAKSINFYDDHLKQVGADFVKNAAIKTVDDVGDATTTTTVLLEAYCKEVFDLVNKGFNPNEIVKQLDNDLVTLKDYISSKSTKVTSIEDIYNIAKVSSNFDDSIANVIKDVYSEVGGDDFDVVIEVTESDSTETTFDRVSGFNLENTGYVHTGFVNNPQRARVDYENPKVYIYNGKVRQMTPDLMRIFEAQADRNAPDFRPMVLVVEDIEEAPLREIITALEFQQIFDVAVVRTSLIAQDRKGAFIDACAYLGTPYKENIITEYGTCEKALITREVTTFINGKGDVTKHVSDLKKKAKNDFGIDRRIKRLNVSSAIIKVGGVLTSDISEKKDRVDDAVLAVKSAIEEGYIIGGGKLLLNAYFDDNLNLSPLTKRVIKSCYNQILINAGIDPSDYINKIQYKGEDFAFDVITNEIVDFRRCGILDSAKALRVSLENAVASAQNFAKIDVVIV